MISVIIAGNGRHPRQEPLLGNLHKIGGASILTVGDSINGGEGGNLV